MNKAIFLDRDGVINIEKIKPICNKEELELYPFVPESIKKINNAGFLAIVITNQSIIARNLCSTEKLDEIHANLVSSLQKEDTKIDRIYYCPHYPDIKLLNGNSEYLIDCDCRKPKSGMLLQAAIEFNIDLQQSYIIGDAERDIICGKNAGVTTIGVRTGKGLNGSTTTPDYLFDNLLEAVNFIVK